MTEKKQDTNWEHACTQGSENEAKNRMIPAGNTIHVHRDGNFIYDICFENSFEDLTVYLSDFEIQNKKICIVTDSIVAELYGEAVRNILNESCKMVTVFSFPSGEENKNLDTLKNLYEHLIQEHFERKDMLIALGGGVTGDLTGFAAATYLRGIDFIQLPTTLLSQVDSSIGGKTGVDFASYKNMVGAFHMPRLVYMNLSTLKTLPEKQYHAGIGEILKHGLIKDAAYYEWLIEHMDDILERDPEVLSEMIYTSCEIKRRVVEMDPKEEGDRALLNFGHTIGHAVEKLKYFKLLHGECVSLGSVGAAYISWKRGFLSDEDFFEIRDMFVGFGLPITFYGLATEDVMSAIRLDKKMESGQIKFILLESLGHAVIDKTVTDQELTAAINYINMEINFGQEEIED